MGVYHFMIAIYARQSLNKADSISIEGQIEICKKEFASNEKYNIYSDKGFSGKDIDRPSFKKMMDDIRNNIVHKVIVYRLDRISRSTLDFANIMDIFKEYNVEFISSTEKFDTSTPIGRAMLSIVMTFAQLERETIQQRISDNYYIRGSKGFYLGGQPPYGYTKEKTTIEGKKTSVLVPLEPNASHVKKMYKLYSQTNMSLGQISKYLNDNNILSPTGKHWDSAKISRILKNPVYVKSDVDVYSYYKENGAIITNEIQDFIGTNGCYLFGKRKLNERKFTNVKNHTLVIAPHKGLVDSNVWLLCQYKLDKNKQIKNSGKGKYSWLSGLTKCGHCHYAMTVVVSDGKYKYLKCRGKYNYHICDGHDRVIKVEDIEEIVQQKLLKKIDQHKIQVSKLEIQEVEDNYLTNKLKIDLVEIDNKIENLINQLAEGNATITKYINQKINELDNRKNKILEEIKSAAINSSPTIKYQDIFDKAKEWNNISLEEKKEICSYYIDKIFIKEDSIEIEWKFTV